MTSNRSAQNVVGAILTIALGTWMLLSSIDFGFGTAAKLGAGVFPALIGGLMVLLGAIWVVQSLLGRFRTEQAEPGPDRRGIISIVVTIGVIIGCALLVEVLGYQLTILLAIGTLLKVVARCRWWVTLIIAAVFAFGTFALFAYGLGVALPVSQLPLLQQMGL